MLGSVTQAIMARHNAAAFKGLVAGAVAVLLAFTGGMMVVKMSYGDWGVLVMGLGFIAALVIFNVTLRRLKRP